MKKIIITLFLCLIVLQSKAQDKSLFEKEIFSHKGMSLPYRILYPQNYDHTKQYPLLLFLHGAGERGNDNESQLIHGTSFFIENNYYEAQFPAIVIAPQCPQDTYWANIDRKTQDGKAHFQFTSPKQATPPLEAVIALTKEFIASGKINKKQVYVGGLSMGGMGTLEILWRMPNTFAAAFPVCGGADLSKLSRYAKTNLGMWLFHGDVDGVVPVENSRRIYQTLKDLGADVRYTEYPGVDHNSWDYTFKECTLMPWLFGHRK
ncbi:phospholipase [Bacteroidales bacterium]|nr:phospholipase [Bacteroidales bacterium]